MESLRIQSVPIDNALRQSEDITKLYIDVFAAPPWNEAFRCTQCQKSFGKEGAENGLCCDTTVAPYYPFAETQQGIKQCLGYEQARISLALQQVLNAESLVGFAWGWQDTLKVLNEEKFKLPTETLDVIRTALKQPSDLPVFYFSEFGTREDLRGRGIGKQLYRELFSSINRETSNGTLMRTSKKSPAFKVATTNPDYPLSVIYEFRDEVERVILASV